MKAIGLISFIAGTLVGGAIAVLVTPKSGRELRRQVKEQMKEEAEEMARRMERMRSRAGDFVQEHMPPRHHPADPQGEAPQPRPAGRKVEVNA